MNVNLNPLVGCESLEMDVDNMGHDVRSFMHKIRNSQQN